MIDIRARAPRVDLDSAGNAIGSATDAIGSAISRIADTLPDRITESLPDRLPSLPTRRAPGMSRGLLFVGAIAGLAAGAVLMYVLDPVQGGRRRALVRDRLGRVRRSAGRAIDGASKQAADRSRGIAAEVRTRTSDEPVDDAVLAARVRSELGRLVEDTGAIQVSVSDGQVILEGHIDEDKADRLVEGVRAIPGVQGVIDRRDVREREMATSSGRTNGASSEPLPEV
jgi:hypothetical protein